MNTFDILSTMKQISAMRLGATLFVPATHKNLKEIATEDKYSTLRSLVIDLEDGIDDTSLQMGLQQLEDVLKTKQSNQLLRFIRPANSVMLEELLKKDYISNIDGFVLPKFDLGNAQMYLDQFKGNSFSFMPSIETSELFDALMLKQIRELLIPLKHRIPLIRFGLEDMFRQLKIRRDCSISIYDMATPSLVVGQLLAVFKPFDFEVASPVYRCFDDEKGFKNEVLRDLQEGLVSKTVIHPKQVEWLESVYQVNETDLADAKELLATATAVIAQKGNMAEIPTQSPWAKQILQRSKLFGIKTHNYSPDN